MKRNGERWKQYSSRRRHTVAPEPELPYSLASRRSSSFGTLDQEKSGCIALRNQTSTPLASAIDPAFGHMIFLGAEGMIIGNLACALASRRLCPLDAIRQIAGG